jgi:hypothetical protein
MVWSYSADLATGVIDRDDQYLIDRDGGWLNSGGLFSRPSVGHLPSRSGFGQLFSGGYGRFLAQSVR